MTQERSVSTVFAALDRDEIESLRAENARLIEALAAVHRLARAVPMEANYFDQFDALCGNAARAALKVQP